MIAKHHHTYISARVVILTLCTLFFSVGCKIHYGFSGASIPPEAKTVSVTYFQNNASQAPPTMSQAFTEALRDKLSSQTRLALIKSDGDLSFEGSITGYAITPVALQSSDKSALNRLTITVNVKYKCLFDDKKNFETSFSRYSDFPGTDNVSSHETQLITDINEQLVQDIFNKALNNW